MVTDSFSLEFLLDKDSLFWNSSGEEVEVFGGKCWITETSHNPYCYCQALSINLVDRSSPALIRSLAPPAY